MRVGLVLGAGGVLGGAWLVGGLHALATETGWDPGSAEYLVGTSAGAMIAGCRRRACRRGSCSRTRPVRTLKRPRTTSARRARQAGLVALCSGCTVACPRSVRARGDWRSHRSPARIATPRRRSWPAGFPQGLISCEPLKQTIRRVAGDGWPPHPNLWIITCEHDTGRRVVFGRNDAPAPSLADAVAASCAIPGFYRPVQIAGRRYVDGGVASTSNLDVLSDLELDLVICLNPTSSLHAPQPRTLGERAAAMLRQASGRQLGNETKRVKASGTEVILVQPTVQDLDAMGTNLMSANRRDTVIDVAAQTVADQLRAPEVRARLRELPPGEPLLVRKPPGPLTPRPDFGRLAHERWIAATTAS